MCKINHSIRIIRTSFIFRCTGMGMLLMLLELAQTQYSALQKFCNSRAWTHGPTRSVHSLNFKTLQEMGLKQAGCHQVPDLKEDGESRWSWPEDDGCHQTVLWGQKSFHSNPCILEWVFLCLSCGLRRRPYLSAGWRSSLVALWCMWPSISPPVF